MFKPMLAPGNDPLGYPEYFNELKFPLLCSPKLDGIRCIVKGGVCKSRSFKDIPSRYVQDLFSMFENLDGEIIVGDETDHDVYNRTQSYVMSEDKFHEDFKFRVFDCADEDLSGEEFQDRLDHARKLIKEYTEHYTETFSVVGNVSIVEHVACTNIEELLDFEAGCLQAGYEGIMMRSFNGKYKHGRGTWREGLIYKLKRFIDDEATIIGTIEQNVNENIQERDELGYSKRSTAKSGLVGGDTLGKFIVKYKEQILEVAPGNFDHTERKFIWDNRSNYEGRVLKFRFFGHGIKDLPRFPRAVGFRDTIDM